jgi:hypothetical protein
MQLVGGSAGVESHRAVHLLRDGEHVVPSLGHLQLEQVKDVKTEEHEQLEASRWDADQSPAKRTCSSPAQRTGFCGFKHMRIPTFSFLNCTCGREDPLPLPLPPPTQNSPKKRQDVVVIDFRGVGQERREVGKTACLEQVPDVIRGQ